MKVFLQRILPEIIGTSDAWSTIHLSHLPSDRAWIYLRLTNFTLTFKSTNKDPHVQGCEHSTRNHKISSTAVAKWQTTSEWKKKGKKYYIHEMQFSSWIWMISKLYHSRRHIDTRYHSIFLMQVLHETTIASSGNHHFFSISCHC